MNKAIGMLAVLAFTASAANAELLKNFKYDGKVEAVGVVVNNSNDFNKDAGDKFGDVTTRVMLNMGFDLNEDANAVVTAVKNNRSYGTSSESVNGVENMVTFEQAYLNLKGVFGIDHQVGRQFYGNNGDIVIYYGPQDWYVRGLAVNALDGWTGNWKKDKLSVSGLAAKIVENNGLVVGNTNNDQDLYGLTAAYDYSDIVKPAAYYYDAKDMSTVGSPIDLQVAGIKANGEYKGVKYGAEYAMNMGRDHTTPQDLRGYAVKANAAYGLDLAGKLGVDAEFAMGSGDKASASKNEGFMDISANYRPGLIMGGIGVKSGVTNNSFKITGLNDLTTWNIGANWTPEKLNKLNLAVKYYDFSPTEKVAGIDHLGTEADLVATWTHSENVSLKLGLGMFMPDKYKLAGKDDSVNLGTLAMNVKF